MDASVTIWTFPAFDWSKMDVSAWSILAFDPTDLSKKDLIIRDVLVFDRASDVMGHVRHNVSFANMLV